MRKVVSFLLGALALGIIATILDLSMWETVWFGVALGCLEVAHWLDEHEGK